MNWNECCQEVGYNPTINAPKGALESNDFL